MTYLEKEKKENPTVIITDIGIPLHCPSREKPVYCGNDFFGDAYQRCTKCWNTEIPKEKEKESKSTVELKIKDSASLNMIVEGLTRNGYRLEIATKWKEWPQNGIDYFCILVKEKEDV